MYDRQAGKPNIAALFELASTQAGYFTAEQGRAHRFSKQLQAHYAATGRFIRIRRGLYRLRDYPSSPHEEVIAAWLATGRDAATVSHESALDLLDLSDVVPNSIHILISRKRRGLPAMQGVTLHTTTHALQPRDVVTREGIRVTAPPRTILDVAEGGTAPEQVVLAIKQARARGWITAADLHDQAQERGERVAQLIDHGLQGDS